MTERNKGKSDVVQGPVTVAIRNLEGELLRLRQGEITNDELRPSRTLMGVYGQRQPEEYMVRVRIPYGGLAPEQLRRLARIARDYGNGVGHITTRQNMQLPWIDLEESANILWGLAEVGLTTLQSGGNSVRTVGACPLAGACPKEAFDVTPYARAVDDHYLGNDSVMHLPRKFKSALSGCPIDCSYSRIQDFGAIARVREEKGTLQKGFQVFVGGGLGVFPRLAEPLEEFLPAEELLPTCEAVIRVFDRLGDRRNKQKARLKFVLQRLGIEEFRRLVSEEREALRVEQEELNTFIHEDEATPLSPASRQSGPEGQAGDDYGQWRRWNVRTQPQDGYAAVLIPLKLGDVTSDQMEVAADLAERHSGVTLRTSQQQDLLLRNMPETDLAAVYGALRSVDLAGLRASGIANVTSCPGTTACSLGITTSKGLANQLVQMLEKASYQEDEAIGALRIKVSGCPDACGHHYMADIGLYGCAVHTSGRLYPAYQLLLGGEVTEEGTRLARPVLKLPARRVPQAVDSLLEHFRSNRDPGEGFSAFVERMGLEVFRELLSEFTHVPPPIDDVWNFIDWDSTRMYILERGEGECAV